MSRIAGRPMLHRSRFPRWTRLAAFAVVSAVVCSAQIPFFSPTNAAAKVTKLIGQVSIQQDLRQTWALQLGGTVQPQQMIVTGPDSYAEFQVSDGSTFEVFSNSKVVFRANPGNLKDLVDLWIGRIKVHIEKLGGQPNPNTVKTPTAVISVRGTTFDVVHDADDDSTLVAVTEGLVEVRHALRPDGKSRLLRDNEVLRVYRNEPIAKAGVDKGMLAARVFRSLQDAVVTIMRNPRTGGPGAGTGSPGPSLPGDTPAEPPPPPPPPPPPNN